MKSKIEEILYKYSERVGLYEGGVITCVDENEFDEIAEEVVKLFAIPDVINSVCQHCGELVEPPLWDEDKMSLVCPECRECWETVL